jgi:hypothetical protein
MTDPLTALRDVPTLLTPERAAGARARTHERIDARIAPPRPRRRGARRAGALALAAVAAAGALVVTVGGGAGGPGVATAAGALHGLGRRVAAQPPVQLGPGEYYAVRIHQYPAAGPADGTDVDMRTWTAGDRRRVVNLVNGRLQRDGLVVPPAPPGPRAPDWSAFPTDPASVAGWMRAAAEATGNHEHGAPTPYDYIITATFMIFGRDHVPPAALQGVYGFLAGLPGIRLVGDVKDPLGRPGTAVAADGDADRESVGIELILDRTTGLPLAVVHYRDGDIAKPWLYTTRQEGVVRGTDALPG